MRRVHNFGSLGFTDFIVIIDIFTIGQKRNLRHHLHHRPVMTAAALTALTLIPRILKMTKIQIKRYNLVC